MDKKGFDLSLNTIIAIALLLVFLLATLPIITSFLSSDFQGSAGEEICRGTLALSKTLDFPFIDRPITPLCKAQLIPFNAKEIQKFRQGEESTKESTMRYLAEKMLRCSKIYNLKSKEGVAQHSYCHICYAFQHDTKDPLQVSFTPEEFKTYLLQAKTSRGQVYLREILDQEVKYLFTLQQEHFTPETTDYAILYIDNVKAADWPIYSAPLVCFLGPVKCWSAAATSAFSFFQQFGESNLDAVIATELKEARKYCEEIISS